MGQIASISNALKENDISELDLHNNLKLNDEENSVVLEVLAENNRSVKILKIRDTSAGNLSLVQLSNVLRKHKNLRELVLYKVGIIAQPAKFKILVNSVGSGIKKISFENCGLNDMALDCIAQNWFCSGNGKCTVEFVNLLGNCFSKQGVVRFLRLLSQNMMYRRKPIEIFLGDMSPESLRYVSYNCSDVSSVKFLESFFMKSIRVCIEKNESDLSLNNKKSEAEQPISFPGTGSCGPDSVVYLKENEKSDELDLDRREGEESDSEDEAPASESFSSERLDELLWDIISSGDSEFVIV